MNQVVCELKPDYHVVLLGCLRQPSYHIFYLTCRIMLPKQGLKIVTLHIKNLMILDSHLSGLYFIEILPKGSFGSLYLKGFEI
jgi:hypothetical protein